MAKAKVVKAKVTKAKVTKRMSKGADYPWEVRAVDLNGEHETVEFCRTKKEAEDYLKSGTRISAPVIIHIDIPAMEY